MSNSAAGDSVGDDSAAGSVVDPETLLTSAGVLEECEHEDDLCLTSEAADAWREAVVRLRGDAAVRESTAALVFDRPVTLDEHDGRPAMRAVDTNREGLDGRRRGDDPPLIHVWVSEGAMLADLAAVRVIADRADWDAVPAGQRLAILKALRSFLDACPVCDGEIEMSEDTVESCCRSFDVLATRCADCGEHFLEIHPETIQETPSGRASVS